MAINTYLSIATLNVNGLNAPIKCHRVANWIKKQDPFICCIQETHFRPTDTHKLKVKGWKKIFHANGKEKKAGVAILISEIGRASCRGKSVDLGGRRIIKKKKDE